MTEGDKIRGIIESAVESAFIDFPHIGHEERWPQNYKENAEQDVGDSGPLVVGKMGLQNRSDFSAGRKPQSRAGWSGHGTGRAERRFVTRRPDPFRHCRA
jgi:hypothetical protein